MYWIGSFFVFSSSHSFTLPHCLFPLSHIFKLLWGWFRVGKNTENNMKLKELKSLYAWHLFYFQHTGKKSFYIKFECIIYFVSSHLISSRLVPIFLLFQFHCVRILFLSLFIYFEIQWFVVCCNRIKKRHFIL